MSLLRKLSKTQSNLKEGNKINFIKMLVATVLALVYLIFAIPLAFLILLLFVVFGLPIKYLLNKVSSKSKALKKI